MAENMDYVRKFIEADERLATWQAVVSAEPAATVDRVAGEFSRVLHEWLTADELAEALRRNASPEYAGCCATHDFCDANMAMQEAFIAAGLPDPGLFHGVHDCGLSTDDLWDAAWDAAKAANFAARR
jgi:hypothetical protein